MKNRKFIYGGIIIVVILLLGVVFIILNNKEDNSLNNKNNQSNNVNEPVAPATNTEKLIDTLEKVEIKSLNNDTIEFSNDTFVEEGDKIAVWVYSEPKFLGYFEVIVEEGIKKIEGLEEALKNIEIENGNHNIALVSEKGEEIGYIDVYIEENELFKDKASKTTIKQIVEEQEFNYDTITEKDRNMLNGTKKVVQKGVKGLKEITYEVIYDGNGKEISKEAIDVKVIKETVNEIIKVGTSDVNINTGYIKGKHQGFYCTEDQTFIYDNEKHCNDIDNVLNEFKLVRVDDVYYVTELKDKNITKAFKVTKVNSGVYSGKYNGVLYYFDSRAGDGEPIKLTKELCDSYKLSCGEW